MIAVEWSGWVDKRDTPYILAARRHRARERRCARFLKAGADKQDARLRQHQEWQVWCMVCDDRPDDEILAFLATKRRIYDRNGF